MNNLRFVIGFRIFSHMEAFMVQDGGAMDPQSASRFMLTRFGKRGGPSGEAGERESPSSQ